ncbi:OmpA family protein [Porphyromonas cangingivalis]|uniref:OmpA family protein n=1 Tax=Porphyromonas cangingivalis TaxID=36874 RepID=UPI001362321B|nr:OmpA family protein [Porphyromonas cangingivalis]
MNKKFIFAMSLALLPAFAVAQTPDEIKEEAKVVKAEVLSKYSRWTIGVYGGVPFTQGGEMVTLGHDKVRIGYTGGLQVGYQFNPFFGMSLSGQYGMIPGASKEWEKDYLVLPNGKTEYAVPADASAVPFKDVYSKITAITAGLHFDFNAAALFASNQRRFALVLSPAVYMQKFAPELKKISGDAKFNTSDLKNDISLGLGGDLDLRYSASRVVDIMLKAGAAWVTNNNFDGIDNTGTERKYGTIGHIAAGVVFKLGASDKVDNIIYAPTARAINKMAAERVAARLEAERLAKEKAEAERIAREKAEAERIAREKAEAERRRLEEEAARRAQKVEVNLPSIHFVRGSAVVNKKKYAKELAEMVEFLNANPTLSVDVVGFCDHTGTEALNDKLSIKRAENVKKYLVSKGIDAARLSAKGMGKDEALSGKAALSIQARRVEVK